MKRVLFLCSRNRRRSPTAERVFAAWPGIEASSAGLAPDAEEVLTAEALEGVDLVVVMERAHRARLQRRFAPHLKRARVVCLDVPDHYAFMDPGLVALLEERAGPHLRRLAGAIISDEGRDADHAVETMAETGGKVVVPSGRSRKASRAHDEHLHRERDAVERFLCELEPFRRVATRNDR